MQYFLSDNASMSHNNTGWDYIVLTASNEKQALLYWEQIKFRLEKGLLPPGCRYAVLPDINGRRIGSGGATFNALKLIREISISEDCFTGKRILIIHSGGDSKRVPQYSVCGKLFSSVPYELSSGISSTLFDEIIRSVSEIPSKMQSGMLTLAGDILVLFNPSQVNLFDCDAAALSAGEKAVAGMNHGVFIPDENGLVKRFLHKSTLAELHGSGAVNRLGKVNLDTGAIWFSETIVKELFGLISTGGMVNDEKFNEFVSEEARLSFYADFVYPMAAGSLQEVYYTEKPEGGYTQELNRCRTLLWKVLHKYCMKLIALSPSSFVHFGSSFELLKLMTTDLKHYSFIGWKSAINTNLNDSGRFSVNSSFIDGNSDIGDGSFIEKSCLYRSKIGRNCIISNVNLDRADIPDNMVVHCLKQKDGDYVARIYGVKDNPKLDIDNKATFLGIPMRKFMKSRNLNQDDLWDSEPYTLWNAKLYSKCRSPEQSLRFAIGLCNDFSELNNNNLRVSLEQSSENADYKELMLWQEELNKKISEQPIMTT